MRTTIKVAILALFVMIITLYIFIDTIDNECDEQQLQSDTSHITIHHPSIPDRLAEFYDALQLIARHSPHALEEITSITTTTTSLSHDALEVIHALKTIDEIWKQLEDTKRILRDNKEKLLSMTQLPCYRELSSAITEQQHIHDTIEQQFHHYNENVTPKLDTTAISWKSNAVSLREFLHMHSDVIRREYVEKSSGSNAHWWALSILFATVITVVTFSYLRHRYNLEQSATPPQSPVKTSPEKQPYIPRVKQAPDTPKKEEKEENKSVDVTNNEFVQRISKYNSYHDLIIYCLFYLILNEKGIDLDTKEQIFNNFGYRYENNLNDSITEVFDFTFFNLKKYPNHTQNTQNIHHKFLIFQRKLETTFLETYENMLLEVYRDYPITLSYPFLYRLSRHEKYSDEENMACFTAAFKAVKNMDTYKIDIDILFATWLLDHISTTKNLKSVITFLKSIEFKKKAHEDGYEISYEILREYNKKYRENNIFLNRIGVVGYLSERHGLFSMKIEDRYSIIKAYYQIRDSASKLLTNMSIQQYVIYSLMIRYKDVADDVTIQTLFYTTINQYDAFTAQLELDNITSKLCDIMIQIDKNSNLNTIYKVIYPIPLYDTSIAYIASNIRTDTNWYDIVSGIYWYHRNKDRFKATILKYYAQLEVMIEKFLSKENDKDIRKQLEEHYFGKGRANSNFVYMYLVLRFKIANLEFGEIENIVKSIDFSGDNGKIIKEKFCNLTDGDSILGIALLQRDICRS